ncbi:hypothetical protein RDI58_021955 [Solanum bulbocastanum]
MDRYI